MGQNTSSLETYKALQTVWQGGGFYPPLSRGRVSCRGKTCERDCIAESLHSKKKYYCIRPFRVQDFNGLSFKIQRNGGIYSRACTQRPK